MSLNYRLVRFMNYYAQTREENITDRGEMMGLNT